MEKRHENIELKTPENLALNTDEEYEQIWSIDQKITLQKRMKDMSNCRENYQREILR